ncbi:MAG: carbamoyltransferase N-terminal domain-containing protein, partial [Acidobacteriota bacterium]
MAILGLGGLMGDAACAVLHNGELKAAIEEAKLTRGNHGAGHAGSNGAIPQAAIAECLKLAGLARDQVDCVAVVRPFARGRESDFHLTLRDQFPKAEIIVVDHHQAHAASAFYTSPFEEATVLTLDHSGDFRCGSRWHAQGTQVQVEREWYYPDSLGRLYGAVTSLLGFESGAEEHKVQWLSASGEDIYAAVFRDVVADNARLDPSYFGGPGSVGGGLNQKFMDRLGLPATIPARAAAAIACSLQRTVENVVFGLAGEGENLCLAGGLFMNVLLVEALERSGRWKNVYVQP